MSAHETQRCQMHRRYDCCIGLASTIGIYFRSSKGHPCAPGQAAQSAVHLPCSMPAQRPGTLGLSLVDGNLEVMQPQPRAGLRDRGDAQRNVLVRLPRAMSGDAAPAPSGAAGPLTWCSKQEAGLLQQARIDPSESRCTDSRSTMQSCLTPLSGLSSQLLLYSGWHRHYISATPVRSPGNHSDTCRSIA